MATTTDGIDYVALRKTHGIPQTEAAKRIGVSLQAWRNWELGSSRPNRENFEKILRILKA